MQNINYLLFLFYNVVDQLSAKPSNNRHLQILRDCNLQLLSTTVYTQKSAERKNDTPQSHEVKPRRFPQISKRDLRVM